MSSSNNVIAYIGLGSNLGDRIANIRHALDEVRDCPGVSVTAVSSFCESEPVDFVDQPDFVNAVAELRADISARELLRTLLKIENKMGRDRPMRFGPRVIDLDILLYNSCIINESGLVVPHPRMHERSFVLLPLEEIAPHAEHPVLGVMISELADNLANAEGRHRPAQLQERSPVL